MNDSTAGPAVSVLRAVSYVRVSTLGQARRGVGPDGLSIPAQRDASRRRSQSRPPHRVGCCVGHVERQVEACHQAVTLATSQADTIRRAVAALAFARQNDQVNLLAETEAQIAMVEASMSMLLDAYYADVLPRDMFLAQQRRLKTERAHLVRERIAITSRPDGQQTMQAIDLLSHASERYGHADPQQPRELHRALFAAIYIDSDPADTRWELNEPYLTIAILRQPSTTSIPTSAPHNPPRICHNHPEFGFYGPVLVLCRWVIVCSAGCPAVVVSNDTLVRLRLGCGS